MTRRAVLALTLLTALRPLAGQPLFPGESGQGLAQANKMLDRSFALADTASDRSLALALYREVAQTPGNFVISPFSLSTTLTMLYAGTSGNTATELAQVLHLSGNPHDPLGALLKELNQPNPAYKLQLTNRIWPSLQLKLKPEFTQLLAKHYEAGLESVDFKHSENARQRINQWVSEQTQGKIPQLLAPGKVDSNTLLILTNAIFFQGLWLRPFPVAETTEGTFQIREGKTVSCPMMQANGMFNYASLDSATVLELPYQGERLSMILILPPANQSLDSLEHRLDDPLWRLWMKALDEHVVSVRLPRFKISTDLSLANPLKAVGLHYLFENCDLGGALQDASSAKVSDCIHQAVIEVNEKGTEAAAATAVVISRSVPRRFEVNRPCLFAVRDRVSESLLFLGRLENPSDGNSP